MSDAKIIFPKITDVEPAIIKQSGNPIARAIQADIQAMEEVKDATRYRRRWGVIRADVLEEWALKREDAGSRKVEQLVRIFFERPDTAVVCPRWTVFTRGELAAWLVTQPSVLFPRFKKLSGYHILESRMYNDARKFVKASDNARVVVFPNGDDPDADRIAVYTGFGSIPDGDLTEDPIKQNLFAVWLGDGEPDCNPEI